MKPRRLRILYVDETLGFGGSMVALRNLVAALDSTRYESAIVLRADNRRMLTYLHQQLPESVRLYPIGRWDLFQRLLPCGVGERFLQAILGEKGQTLWARAEWALASFTDTLPTAVRIASIAKRWKADAIHTNEQLLTNVAGVLAARLAGLPCFSHNRMFGLRPRLARYIIPLVTHFFAISEYIRQDLEKGGVPAPRISVVYDGVDLAQFTPQANSDKARKELGIASNQCVVGFFGRLVEWKGHEFFLNAFALASRQDPSLVGLVVGDTSPPGGPLMQRLKARAVGLAIQDRVRFLGYRTDVARVMSATQIIVVPSIEPEPAGLVNFEAMAMSRPIVATRVGGIPELVTDGENGLLIPVGDVEAFAAAMLRLSRDREFAQRLGKNGRHIVEQQFAIQKYAEGISKVYDRFLNPRVPARPCRTVS